MKAGRSSVGDRRKAPVKGNDDSVVENWDDQVDYPVPREGKEEEARPNGQAGAPLSREELIRMKAYYRAQQRGFNGGNETEDWLQAEREVDEGSSERR